MLFDALNTICAVILTGLNKKDWKRIIKKEQRREEKDNRQKRKEGQLIEQRRIAGANPWILIYQYCL